MKKTVRIFLAVILTVALTAAGFFGGYQITEDVPLEAPYQEKQITMSVSGASAARCAELVCSELMANRLVENLMLRCAPEDLHDSLGARTTGADTFVVTLPMEEEGQMVYFAEELSYLLDEELGKEAEGACVTMLEDRMVTITAEQQNSMTFAMIGAGLGMVIGALAGVVLVLLGRKSGESTK